MLNTNAISAQVLQLKTISNEVLIRVKKFISFQQYVIYIRFYKYHSAPTYFLEHSSIFIIPDENKLFWQFHHNENSNSIMLASIHHRILRPASILASFEST